MPHFAINKFSIILPIALCGIAVAIGFVFSVQGYTLQGTILLLVVVAFICLYFLQKRKIMTFPVKMVLLGLLSRLAFSLVRHFSSFVLYGGAADAAGYHKHGMIVAQHIWQLNFADVEPYLEWGTRFIEFFTGIIYTLFGPDIYTGYLFFGVIAFFGSYYFFKAFQEAFPKGNITLFALLIFFFPSLLFWSNGIGKDAPIFLFLAIFAYGGALVHKRTRGFVFLLIGLLGVLWIRPHIAAISAMAFILASLLGPQKNRRSGSIVSFLLLIGAAGVFVWFVVPMIGTFIGLDEITPQSLLERFQVQGDRTLQGGSAFNSIDITKPQGFPLALITLLFRPFPWESHNILAFIQSLEGMLLLCLVIWRIRSIISGISAVLSNTYIRYIVIYLVCFIIIFSMVANFGIIARERTMFLPFFFMLICYSSFHKNKSSLGVTQQ